MKAYTYQIGKGTLDALETVAYSREVLADSLGEAIDKSKAVTSSRPPSADEGVVVLLDPSRSQTPMVWSRLAKDIREG